MRSLLDRRSERADGWRRDDDSDSDFAFSTDIIRPCNSEKEIVTFILCGDLMTRYAVKNFCEK